jgi:hypothetical protein
MTLREAGTIRENRNSQSLASMFATQQVKGVPDEVHCDGCGAGVEEVDSPRALLVGLGGVDGPRRALADAMSDRSQPGPRAIADADCGSPGVQPLPGVSGGGAFPGGGTGGTRRPSGRQRPAQSHGEVCRDGLDARRVVARAVWLSASHVDPRVVDPGGPRADGRLGEHDHDESAVGAARGTPRPTQAGGRLPLAEGPENAAFERDCTF